MKKLLYPITLLTTIITSVIFTAPVFAAQACNSTFTVTQATQKNSNTGQATVTVTSTGSTVINDIWLQLNTLDSTQNYTSRANLHVAAQNGWTLGTTGYYFQELIGTLNAGNSISFNITFDNFPIPGYLEISPSTDQVSCSLSNREHITGNIGTQPASGALIPSGQTAAQAAGTVVNGIATPIKDNIWIVLGILGFTVGTGIVLASLFGLFGRGTGDSMLSFDRVMDDWSEHHAAAKTAGLKGQDANDYADDLTEGQYGKNWKERME